MATYQPARRRPRIRKTRLRSPRRNRRPTRRRALPALHWGWYATGGITVLAAAKTWPVPMGAAIALLAVIAIVSVVRPRRLAGLFSRIAGVRYWINRRRRVLPEDRVLPLATFERMRPDVFERAIAELARKNKAEVHSASAQGGANDRGLDVLVELNDGRRILIQCKRYTGKNKVTSDDVQKVNGTWQAVHRCHLAVIVTTSSFTRSAVETNLLFNPRIRLMDGVGLVQWANGGTPPWR